MQAQLGHADAAREQERRYERDANQKRGQPSVPKGCQILDRLIVVV